MNPVLRQRVMTALLAFNLTVIVVALVLYFAGIPGGSPAGGMMSNFFSSLGLRLLIAAGVGLVVAAAAFLITGMTHK